MKWSTNLGKDDYPKTLTEAFNMLVRESGEYDSVRRAYSHRFGFGHERGHVSYLPVQLARDDNQNNIMYSRTNSNNSQEIVVGTDGETHPSMTCFGC